MHRRALVLLTAVAPAAALASATLEQALARCRQLADAGPRLACYDGIAPVTPAAARPPESEAARADRFGLPERADGEPRSITSAVGPGFSGWGPGSRIALQNGQVWEVVDSSAGVVGTDNREVTVRRGLLGSFFLDFKGLNNSPRVRRVR